MDYLQIDKDLSIYVETNSSVLMEIHSSCTDTESLDIEIEKVQAILLKQTKLPVLAVRLHRNKVQFAAKLLNYYN